MKTTRKLLVVGPSWVGDMVMAQSLFIALKDQYPSCQIDVLAPEWTFALLAKMPQVRHAIALPTTHGQFELGKRYQLGKQLRSEQYDQAIVLPNSWKSALIPFFAHIPVRTGYIGEGRWGLLNDTRKLDKSILTMTVQRFVALGFGKHAPQPPTYREPLISADKAAQDSVLQKFKLSRSDKILALCPGAEYGASKRWPAQYFAEVALAKIQQGWQVWLLGSKKDTGAGEIINTATQHQCQDFIGRTTLTEAIDLLSLACNVVANDSGLMHLAAALNKPVIAIYGSTPPEFAPPLCPTAQTVFLNLPCAPCFKRECPLYPPEHESHTQCLTGIKPKQILAVLESIH